MLFILGGMAYLKNAEILKPFPQLSEDSIIGEISYPESEKRNDIYDTLISSGLENNRQFILAAQFNSINSVAVYYTDAGLFPVELIEGRIFNDRDFTDHTNVVLVNEDTRKICEDRGGDLWWKYAGNEYKVIGVYREQDLQNGIENNCYINLLSSNLYSNSFTNFIFDAKTNSVEIFYQISQSLIEQYQDIYIGYVPLADSKDSEYVSRGTNYKPMELMLIVTAVLVLFNSISVSMNWLLWYKKEIAVRKLCGANKSSINIWIIKKFISYILISGVIGILGTNLFMFITKYLPVAESTKLMFGNKIMMPGVFLGMGCVFIICGIIVAVIVKQYSKQTISEIIK
jgi:hypothetical protein